MKYEEMIKELMEKFKLVPIGGTGTIDGKLTTNKVRELAVIATGHFSDYLKDRSEELK